MIKTVLALPDGTELSSGEGTRNAIKSATITQCVNDSQELTLGSTCSNMIEITAITPNGGFSIAEGDEFAVYREDADGVRYKVGMFTAEKPTRASTHSLKITAYDRVSWLDKDLTQWLSELIGWPYRLLDFAKLVCDACGLMLINEEIPNGDHLIQKFSATGVTGRQLMQKVGEASCRFCRATADGDIELAWYTPTDITISATGDRYYFQNGFSYEDYEVTAIEKVQVKTSGDDVGTVYPDIAAAVNTYVISGNYLLISETGSNLQSVIQTIYEQLRDVSYTPCKVSVPVSLGVNAADIVKITDKNGKEITAYVMTRKQTGQKVTLECTGSARRSSTTAVNNQSYKILSGKILNLRTDVDGLRVENRNTAGQVASLDLDIQGIRTEVSRQSSEMGQLAEQVSIIGQTADHVSIELQNIREHGSSKVTTTTGYTFNEIGLRIQKSGQEIENLVDHTGMYVTRSAETLLQANAGGVVAADVKVRNYLWVGSYARLEDYNDGRDDKRTACFWREVE